MNNEPWEIVEEDRREEEEEELNKDSYQPEVSLSEEEEEYWQDN
jgi:hypothetical protein